MTKKLSGSACFNDSKLLAERSHLLRFMDMRKVPCALSKSVVYGPSMVDVVGQECEGDTCQEAIQLAHKAFPNTLF
jgi:hypothetical protein